MAAITMSEFFYHGLFVFTCFETCVWFDLIFIWVTFADVRGLFRVDFWLDIRTKCQVSKFHFGTSVQKTFCNKFANQNLGHLFLWRETQTSLTDSPDDFKPVVQLWRNIGHKLLFDLEWVSIDLTVGNFPEPPKKGACRHKTERFDCMLADWYLWLENQEHRLCKQTSAHEMPGSCVAQSYIRDE